MCTPTFEWKDLIVFSRTHSKKVALNVKKMGDNGNLSIASSSHKYMYTPSIPENSVLVGAFFAGNGIMTSLSFLSANFVCLAVYKATLGYYHGTVFLLQAAVTAFWLIPMM